MDYGLRVHAITNNYQLSNQYHHEPKKINIAIVGLGFGAEFIPIYQKHPLANMYAICQRNEDKLNEIGDAFGVAEALHGLR
jgi:predicted dehydrogenase